MELRNRLRSYLLRTSQLVTLIGLLATISLADESTEGNGTSDSQPKPNLVKIALVGDSTVTDQAGWGHGFKSLMSKDAVCLNHAKSGRSSRSFRSEGHWKKCLTAAPNYVLIQFGHNDQPGKGPSRESQADGDFRKHLSQFVDEARENKIQPILITSLTRRRWNSEGKIEESLTEYAAATRIVAREKSVPLIDLHQRSIEQCEAIGPTAFRLFEPMNAAGADHTHLNHAGSLAVASLLVADLVAIAPELKRCFDQEKTVRSRRPQAIPDSISNGSLTVHQTKKTITIRNEGRTVITYNKVSPAVPTGIPSIYQRSGFLHPVMTPNKKIVTAAFPADHPHQHGIFSAWVSTKWNDHAIDFWNLAEGTGKVMHQSVQSIFQNEKTVGFEVDLIHRAEKPNVVDVLSERWRVTAYPTKDDANIFDIHSVQKARTSIPLQVNKFHYGGFAVRGPMAWLPHQSTDSLTPEHGCEITNDQGIGRATGNHMETQWVTMSGMLGEDTASITMMSAPANFRSPQTARLHPKKPYFCFAACVSDQIIIDNSHPMESRYRFLVTDSKPSKEWVGKQWKDWINQLEREYGQTGNQN